MSQKTYKVFFYHQSASERISKKNIFNFEIEYIDNHPTEVWYENYQNLFEVHNRNLGEIMDYILKDKCGIVLDIPKNINDMLFSKDKVISNMAIVLIKKDIDKYWIHRNSKYYKNL